MKATKGITLLVLILLPLIAIGQAEPKYVYCQVTAQEKFMSKKVNVELDFGQKMKYMADNRLKDDKGNAIKFNTVIDALNYMGKQGWELVQTSAFAVNGLGGVQLLYLATMQKPFSMLDEEAKKEYMKSDN